MKVSWFQDPDNVSYVNVDDFAENFGKEIGENNLRSIIEDFKSNPTDEGILVKGTKRTSMRLFIPNRFFDTPIEMGGSVWAYLGEFYPAYCLYWN